MIQDVINGFPDVSVPVLDGGFKLVYEPDPEHPNTWMVNDHCIIQDSEGIFHYFGIENPFPSTTEALEWLKEDIKPSQRPFIQTLHRLMHGHLYRPGTHFRIGHAIANNIWGPWKRLPAALDGGTDRLHHGAPFVIKHDDKYWMFESEGSMNDNALTGIFTSTDLKTWIPVTDATPWRDTHVFGLPGHRDPCIIQLDNGTFLQYFSGSDPDNRTTIGVASSTNLRIWRSEAPCYIEDIPGAPFSSILESPFVLRRGRLYYLFVGFSHRHYYETFVVVSENPYSFSDKHKLTTLFTHAAEFIDVDGETYMTSCGIEDPQLLNRSGLWLCKIRWVKP